MTNRNVFVTVGTTKFDKLVQTITSDNILCAISDLGYTSITIQIGNGTYIPEKSDIIEINYYRLKSSIKEDIKNATLVISHAGAGSCLEILNAHKPLIAVINEDLMGNHQFELASALSKRKYLHYCTCSELLNTLIQNNFESLKPYPQGDPKKFVEYLDVSVGFKIK